MIKSCAIFGTRFSNNKNKLVLMEHIYMGPKLTQAEGFVLGVSVQCGLWLDDQIILTQKA